MERLKVYQKVQVLFLPGAFNSPAARFRIWQFIEPFKKSGYEVTVRVPVPDREGKGRDGIGKWIFVAPKIKAIIRCISTLWLLRDVEKFDFLITNRDFVPELGVKFLERWVIKRGCKLIFDFDDAIHLGRRSRKLAGFLSDCKYVTPGNPFLAEYALAHNRNVQIIPTVVNTNQYVPARTRVKGKFRVGWSGSESTNRYCLPILRRVIERLSRDLDFEFVVISNVDPQIEWDGVQYRFIAWNPKDEIENLQLFDIGLMPLLDNDFERGKCGLKAIQYMALGIPALVSPVGVNKEIVDHGVDGFHCNDTEEWVRAIEDLVQNCELRQNMGRKARQKVEQRYSVDSAMELWNKVLLREC